MMSDLADVGGPVSDLFADRRSGESQSLNNEQVDFYEKYGYLAGVRILNDVQLDALRSALVELMQPRQASNPLFYEFHLNESGDEHNILFHALGAWRVSEAFHDLIFSRAFTQPASELLGGSIRLWHDQVFVKPAHQGGIVAWHQDYSYWTRTKPMNHLTCWIGLDDSTKDNGCLHYIPGSHKWDLLPRGSLADDMDAVLDRLTDEQRQNFEPVAVELKAGEASFHHPLLIHGSFENRSDKARRAAVINVFGDGVISDTDEPLLEGVPTIPRGTKIEGRFFPLLS